MTAVIDQGVQDSIEYCRCQRNAERESQCADETMDADDEENNIGNYTLEIVALDSANENVPVESTRTIKTINCGRCPF